MIKYVITYTLLSLYSISITAQCSTVSVQVSSSDTSFIQLYNAGFFNIPSGDSNVCEWYVTDFAENLIHEDITSGAFEEQSFSSFNHSVPITDSMKVNLSIFNSVEGTICTINDTLYWKETEVIPGSFIGNWEVLSSNGGIEDFEVSPAESNFKNVNITISPSPTSDFLSIVGELNQYSVHILNSTGQFITRNLNVIDNEKIDVRHLDSGLYFIYILDNEKKFIASQKVIKI